MARLPPWCANVSHQPTHTPPLTDEGVLCVCNKASSPFTQRGEREREIQILAVGVRGRGVNAVDFFFFKFPQNTRGTPYSSIIKSGTLNRVCRKRAKRKVLSLFVVPFTFTPRTTMAAVAQQRRGGGCHTTTATRAIIKSGSSQWRHQRPVAAAAAARWRKGSGAVSRSSSTSSTMMTTMAGWRKSSTGVVIIHRQDVGDGRPRAWSGRCSSSRWSPPPPSEEEEEEEEEDDSPIDLDAGEAIPEIEMPSGACA